MLNMNPARVVYPSSSSSGKTSSMSKSSLNLSIPNLPSINHVPSSLSVAIGSSSSSMPGMSPTIPSKRSFKVIKPSTLPNSSTTRDIWTYPWFSLNSFNNSNVSKFSETTNGSLTIVLMSKSSLLNIMERISFACTTPIKSSNSPVAIGKIDLLLSIIFTLLSSLGSSKSIHMISFLGVMIDSTFWSSSLNTLLMMFSSSCSMVPSSIPSLIINSISSSVTISSFLFSILISHKRKLLDFART